MTRRSRTLYRVRLLLAGGCGDLVRDGLVEQRSKRRLSDLLERGQLHASHREPARSLPPSSVGNKPSGSGSSPP